MKIFLKGRENQFDATATLENGIVTVLKGSRVKNSFSEKIASKALEARKNVKMDNFVIKENVSFDSASTAGAFVTGNSTNGLRAWKNSDGKELGTVFSGKQRKPKKEK